MGFQTVFVCINLLSPSTGRSPSSHAQNWFLLSRLRANCVFDSRIWKQRSTKTGRRFSKQCSSRETMMTMMTARRYLQDVSLGTCFFCAIWMFGCVVYSARPMQMTLLKNLYNGRCKKPNVIWAKEGQKTVRVWGVDRHQILMMKNKFTCWSTSTPPTKSVRSCLFNLQSPCVIKLTMYGICVCM